MVKRGIQRQLGKPPKQKLAITPDILKKINSKLDFTTGLHVAFWAACLVCFFAFLRKSTLLPKSSGPKEVEKSLMLKDLLFKDSSNVDIVIRHSKTIQFGQRRLTIPLAGSPGSKLCPVSAVTALLSNLRGVKLSNNQPLFSYVDSTGKVSFLNHSSFVHLLRDILKMCNMDSTSYSGHSFRRGGCSFAFQLGISPILIKLRGDWKSNAFERYVTIQDKQHFDFAKALSLSAV